MRGAGWETIRAEALRRIRSREWEPGALIPAERELAQQFGVARATVNRALQALADDGLIERRRRTGSRVTLHPVRRAVLEIAVTRLEVEASGRVHGFRLIDIALAAPPPAVARRIGVAPAVRLWHLHTLHLADDAPYLLEDRWLAPDGLPADPQQEFARISVNEWLVRHMPYVTGDIGFSAAAADPFEALQLGVEPGTPLFIVDRTTWAETAVITSVRLAYAPGYRLETVV